MCLCAVAEGPPGRAARARRRAPTLQAASHKDGSGTGSGSLPAITAGQAARNGLCRPPGGGPRASAKSRQSPETVETPDLWFPILLLLDLGLASASCVRAAPAAGVKAGPPARPHGLGLDPGEDAATLEPRKPAHAACSGDGLVRACS